MNVRGGGRSGPVGRSAAFRRPDTPLVSEEMTMSPRMIVLAAFVSALWLYGLIGQIQSGDSAMQYLALSLGIVAVAVWRWQPKQFPVRRRFRDRLPRD
jgi:hypothetical protein